MVLPKLPKLPVDLKTLAKAGEVFSGESVQDATWEVLVDVTASRELVVLCRSVLERCSPSAQLRVSSFANEAPRLGAEASLTMIVAGSSPHLRRLMERALWSESACVFFTENSARLLACVDTENAAEVAATLLEVQVHEPRELLEHTLAKWCILHLPSLRLALGVAFPFMRRTIALDLTQQTAFQNAVIASVFFLPGADLPTLTLNQCKLLYEIAVMYEVPLTRTRLVEIGLVIVSALCLRGLSRLLLDKGVPFAWLVRGSIAFGATMSLGHLAYEVYSKGGGVAELLAGLKDAPPVKRAREAAPTHKPRQSEGGGEAFMQVPTNMPAGSAEAR